MQGFVDSEEANLVCSAMCDTFKGLCKLRAARQGLEKHGADADGPELREVSGLGPAPLLGQQLSLHSGAVVAVYLRLYTWSCSLFLMLTNSGRAS